MGRLHGHSRWRNTGRRRRRRRRRCPLTDALINPPGAIPCLRSPAPASASAECSANGQRGAGCCIGADIAFDRANLGGRSGRSLLELVDIVGALLAPARPPASSSL